MIEPSDFTFRDLRWQIATPLEKFEMVLREHGAAIFAAGATLIYLSLHLYWAWAAGRIPFHA